MQLALARRNSRPEFGSNTRRASWPSPRSQDLGVHLTWFLVHASQIHIYSEESLGIRAALKKRPQASVLNRKEDAERLGENIVYILYSESEYIEARRYREAIFVQAKPKRRANHYP